MDVCASSTAGFSNNQSQQTTVNGRPVRQCTCNCYGNAFGNLPGPNPGLRTRQLRFLHIGIKRDGRRSGSGRGILADDSGFQQDVESDGITNASDRDAPGQNCTYIISGNTADETYRTATFLKFPEDSPVFVIALAKAGFYYTGYKDRVKCFSCGMNVEQWAAGDDVFQAKWHKRNCRFWSETGDPRNIPAISEYLTLCKNISNMPSRRNAVGSNSTSGSQSQQQQQNQYNEVASRLQNVNITNNSERYQANFQFAQMQDEAHRQMLQRVNLIKEDERRKTYLKWPSYPAPYLPAALAKNGFFYLGNLDRTQCIFCGGVLRNWSANDNVEQQHRRHFPECRMLLGLAQDNIAMTDAARHEAEVAERARMNQLRISDDEPIVEPPGPSQDEQRRLALLYPLNNAVNPHMESYQERLQSFEQNWPARTRATPAQIAKAGFYYLGVSDKTKCYYCNGGLQNWERNDEPWTEHAKWFPGCAFIIRNKGQTFVRNLYDLHPNLNRPTIRFPVSLTNPPGQQQRNANTELNIRPVVDMGFSEENVREAMRRKTAQDGRGYTNIQDLIDDLVNDVWNLNQSSSPTPASTPATQATASSTTATTAPSAVKRNNGEASTSQTQETPSASLEPELCKNCNERPVDTVFMPCGHFVSCADCAKNANRCFLCKGKIHNHLKVYRA